MSNIKMEELHPTYQQIARIIGIENALKLGKEIGGENLYLPKLTSHYSPLLRERDRKIFAEFGSMPANQLARKYGVTARWLYDIVRRVREEKKAAKMEVK
ncbi:MAG: hypothetical protein HY786_09640 [Deltaproteobacteria bacterium]|nr:hypothetical protein [Deltaproteobacteria bacterium]